MTDQKWFTVAEAAKYLRLSTKTVYRLIKSKDLKPYRSGDRKIVLDHGELEMYLRQRKDL